MDYNLNKKDEKETSKLLHIHVIYKYHGSLQTDRQTLLSSNKP